MTRPRAARLAVLAAVLIGLLAGCDHTAVVAPGQVLRIAIGEYRINPDHARTRPGVVTIWVHNGGLLTHNLVVSDNGQTIASTLPLQPGAGAELAINLPPGRYLLASTLLNDQILGIYGTLEARR